ncbi:MAG: hypothetical protein HY319_00435 [Armatimonadetes bacterium]|nr:hypothetical protein [Armatimonadota bacterium]
MIISRHSVVPAVASSSSPAPQPAADPQDRVDSSEWKEKLGMIGFAAGAGAVVGTVGALTGRVSFGFVVGGLLTGGAAYAMGRTLDTGARRGAAFGGLVLGAVFGGAGAIGGAVAGPLGGAIAGAGVGALAGLTMALRD